MSNNDYSTFSQFFKKDAKLIKEVINPSPVEDGLNQKEIQESSILSIPFVKEPADEVNLVKKWQQIRSFYYNSDNTEGLSSDFIPVHLSPMFTKHLVASEYPLFVVNDQTEGEQCLSFKKLLINGLEVCSNKLNRQSVIQNKLSGVLQLAHEKVEKNDGLNITKALTEILTEVGEKLELNGAENELFEQEVKIIHENFPKKGFLFTNSELLPYYLMESALSNSIKYHQDNFKSEIEGLISKLKGLLIVESNKQSVDSGTNENPPSFADSILQFDKLSTLKVPQGSELMEPERKQRIETVLDNLEDSTSLFDEDAHVFIGKHCYSNSNINWNGLFASSDIMHCTKESEAEEVAHHFKENVALYKNVFVAKRIGELELENKYKPELHNAYFDNFSWESFTTEELVVCPRCILITTDKQLINNEFYNFSETITSNFPIKYFIIKTEEDDIEEDKRKLHAHAELGSLLFSSKNLFLHQGNTITPQVLYTGLKEGLDAFAPACFYVYNSITKDHLNPLVWSSAMLESRDFPNFTYKGILGTPYGARFCVSNNPCADLDWPVHTIDIVEEDNQSKLDVAFTFCDLASLHQQYEHYFLNIEPQYWNKNLVYLPHFLKLNLTEAIGKIPFIWMVNNKGHLQKVAVSETLVRATQERLDFWRLLQENSGINNFHVTKAVEENTHLLNETFAEKLEEIKGKHKAEILEIKEQEANTVMENLTNVLLDLDVSQLPSNPTKPNVINKPIASLEESIKTLKEEQKEEVVELEDLEAYIDTPLCTTCNECTGINNKVFKYNTEKLAYIEDVTAGSFKEMVEAAELCPVGIIHPGTPINKTEENLEDLIVRASKFNA